MAEYRVPINFTYEGVNWKIGKGVCEMNLDKGNVVSGRIKSSASTKARVRNDQPGTLYWNAIYIDTHVMQGDKHIFNTYEDVGRFYPTYEYTIRSNFDEPYIQGTVPKVEVVDAQNMFDVGVFWLTHHLDQNCILDGTIVVEKPNNFSCYTKDIFEDIIVNFEMKSANIVKYRLLQNGVVIRNWSTATDKRITIAKGTLKTNDNVVVEAYSLYNFNSLNSAIQGETVTYTVSGLRVLEAEKPQNIRIVGTERSIEEDLLFAWDTIDMSHTKATFEIWQNGIMIYSVANITNKQFALPAGTLKNTDSIEVRVKNTKIQNGYVAHSDYITLRVSDLKTIKPNLSGFTITGTNRDYDITVIPQGTGATKYKVNNVDGLLIAKGRLPKGSVELTLTAYATSSKGVTVSTSLTKEFTIVQDEPEVYSLEPHNLNINIESPSSVSFSTSQFVDRWEYVLNGRAYTQGTTDRIIPIASDVLTKGANTHKIKLYYSPSYNSNDIRVAERISTFTGYGKPQTVQLDQTLVYNNATPTFTWQNGSQESDKQVAYEIEIIDKETGSIVEEKTVVTAVQSYTVESPLLNNKQYTVQVSIKNKYDMWSNWSAKNIQTNFNNLPIPVLILSSNTTGVTLKIDTYQPPKFKEIKVFRKDDIHEEWICIANNLNSDETMVDYVPQPNVTNYYKARMYDTDGGYSESKVYQAIYNLRHYTLTNVQDFSNHVSLVGAISDIRPVQNVVSKVFAGQRTPEVYTNRTRYMTGTIKYVCDIANVHMIEKLVDGGKIFCYRDWRGRKLYCFINIDSVTYEDARLNTVIMKLTEVNFSEENMYTGNGYKKIVYLDGTYILDGSVDMSMYDPRANRKVMYNAILS